MKTPFVAVALLLLTVLITGCTSHETTRMNGASSPALARDGKTDYSIVLPAGASASELRGAHELQVYLAAASGVSFPILSDSAPLPAHAILVGYSKYTDALGLTRDPSLGDEGFVLITRGPHLIIAGSAVRGTMYGCYAFLDSLGIRFFTPTVTQIPHLTKIDLPTLNEKQIPSFEYREPFFTEAFDKDWASRNLVNGNSQKLDASTGGKIKYSAHFVHTFDALVPQELYKTHPEYFPLIQGNRKIGYVQRCLTNPDVLKLSIDAVNKWIAEEPDATIFSVSQNDCGDWCQCENCTKLANQYGGQSGLYIWFVNQVAGEIKKKHPDKLIDTLAYQFTESHPKDIKPLDNVRVRLCPINVCLSHPYEKDTHPNTIAFVERLKGWASLTDTLYIWHYNISFGHYLMPFADFNQVPDSIQLYKRSGVKGVFFEGDYAPGGGGAEAEMRSYLMAKMLWNCNLDPKAIVADWIHGVYGPAAPPMQEYHDMLQAAFVPPNNHLFCYDGPRIEIFTPDLMKKANALFDQAEGLAQTDQQRRDLKKARIGIRYVELVHHPRTDKALDDFLADVRSFGIQNISEGQNVDAWEKGYREKWTQKK